VSLDDLGSIPGTQVEVYDDYNYFQLGTQGYALLLEFFSTRQMFLKHNTFTTVVSSGKNGYF
jgi:hypothetical protein